MKKLLILLLLVGSVLGIQAQAPASASQIMQKAQATAAAEKKNVFVIFHASWCGWCHKMDTSMNDASVKKYFTDNYVIEHLTVLESDKNKALENPGGMEMLAQYKGDKGGIPFWLIFDSKGTLLADSKIKGDNDPMGVGDNAGCPASEKEVEYFVKVLKKTSKITLAEQETVRKLFRKNE